MEEETVDVASPTILEISEEMYTITDNVITIDGTQLLKIDDNIQLSIGEDDSASTQLIILSDDRVACLNEQTEETCSLPEKPLKKNKKVKGSKIYQCSEPHCNRFYRTLNHLKVHLRYHTGDKPYNCTIEGCDKAFSTEYSRKAHVRTHTGEKPYSCPDAGCSKAFITSGDLAKHVRTHTGERPFVCAIDGCTRAFTTSNIRKIHWRTHTGERPYVCEVQNCKRSFASSTNHKNHMRIHSGEKPYECNSCGKRFTEYSSLYKHNMVHSQVKNYVCTYCPKKYRQLSTLTTHKKVIHGIFSGDDGNDIVFEELIPNMKEENEHSKLRLCGIEPQNKCCNKTFSCKSNLITHLKTQHNLTIEESEEGIIVQIEKDEESLDSQLMNFKNNNVIKIDESSPLFYITQDDNENDELGISEEIILKD